MASLRPRPYAPNVSQASSTTSLLSQSSRSGHSAVQAAFAQAPLSVSSAASDISVRRVRGRLPVLGSLICFACRSRRTTPAMAVVRRHRYRLQYRTRYVPRLRRFSERVYLSEPSSPSRLTPRSGERTSAQIIPKTTMTSTILIPDVTARTTKAGPSLLSAALSTWDVCLFSSLVSLRSC